MSNPKSVMDMARKQGARMVDVKFVDTFGTWQHFSVPVSELTLEVFEDGFGFDGSSIRGWKSIEASDMLAMPDPDTAFRFAKGLPVLHSSLKVKVHILRPLDFLVVSDHSDNLGFFPKLFSGDPAYLADPTGKRWYDMVKAGGVSAQHNRTLRIKAGVKAGGVSVQHNRRTPAIA